MRIALESGGLCRDAARTGLVYHLPMSTVAPVPPKAPPQNKRIQSRLDCHVLYRCDNHKLLPAGELTPKSTGPHQRLHTNPGVNYTTRLELPRPGTPTTLSSAGNIIDTIRGGVERSNCMRSPSSRTRCISDACSSLTTSRLGRDCLLKEVVETLALAFTTKHAVFPDLRERRNSTTQHGGRKQNKNPCLLARRSHLHVKL